MRKSRYLAISLALSFGLLLNIVTFSANAGDVMITGGVGLHTFNLSVVGDKIYSEGHLSVTNTLDEDIAVSVLIDNALKPVDLAEDGSPRTHRPTGDRLVYRIPNISWIRPVEEVTVIPANSVGGIDYIVEAPIDEVYEALDGDINKSFLCYFNVRGASSTPIGINYDHKVFICFIGDFPIVEEGTNLVALYLGLFFIILAVIYSIFTIIRKRKKKEKKSKVPVFETTEYIKKKEKDVPVFKTNKLITDLDTTNTFLDFWGKNNEK